MMMGLLHLGKLLGQMTSMSISNHQLIHEFKLAGLLQIYLIGLLLSFTVWFTLDRFLLDICGLTFFLYVFLSSSAYRPSFQSFKGNGGEVVDRVVLCSDKNNNMCIKFIIRHTRRPEVKSCWVYCECELMLV